MRRTLRIPALVHHRPSGQGRVRFGGRDYYLGKYGEAETEERYRRLVAELLTTGTVTVDRPAGTPGGGISVAELLLAYLPHAERHYRKDGKPTSELHLVKDAMRLLRLHYGMTPAAEFGPLRLKAIREALIARGLRRKSINQRIGRVKRIFKWGVANELIPPSVHHGLSAVAGLSKGRTEAPESPPVLPVAEGVVKATLPHLNAQVRAMVEIQSLTGCRPGEVCLIRPGDLDRSDDVWSFVPGSHKTQHHDRGRVVYIGPKAQAVLSPWLEGRSPGAWCFSPAEAEATRRIEVHAARKTPLSCGNRPGSKRRGNPKWRPGERYTVASYRQAIERACKAAKVPKWNPNRLRHSRSTEIRKEYGLEAAQVVMGHARADVTQVYAERDAALARKVAAETG